MLTDPSRHPPAPHKARSPERSARCFVLPTCVSAVCVAAVCFSIVGITGWQIHQAYDHVVAESRATAATLARTFAGQAETVFTAGDLLVAALVDRLETGGASPSAVAQLQQTMVTRLAGSPRVQNLIVHDADGTWLASATATSSSPSAAQQEYVFYHHLHPERGAHLGRPALDPVSGHRTITLSRRFDRTDGSIGGIAVAVLDYAQFENFYSGFDVGPNGSISLLNENGSRILRVPGGSETMGENLSGTPLFQSYRDKGPVGASEARSVLNGLWRYASFRRVEHYPVVVFVNLAQNDALAEWQQEAAMAGAAAVLLALALAVLGLRLASQIRFRNAAEAAVRRSETKYRFLAEYTTDVIIHLDSSSHRTYVSPACLPALGYTPEEMIGHHPRDLCCAEDWPAVERHLATEAQVGATPPISFRARHKDGNLLWMEAVTRRVRGGQGTVATLRDISGRKQVEHLLHKANNELQRMVTQDGLTGIANRLCFDNAIAKEHRRAARSELPLALLMLDVDHFKRFNDAYGHPAGDACLRAIAKALSRQSLRPADLTARYGGEEFAVLLPETDIAGAMRLAERALTAVRALGIPHRDNLYGIATISIGAAVIWPRQDSPATADLVQRADKALYRAKAIGRDRVCLDTHEPPPIDLDRTMPRTLSLLL